MSFIYKSNCSQHVQVIELGYADVKRLEANNSKQPNTEDYGKFRTSFDKSSDLYHCLVTNIENTATYSMQRYSDEEVADVMTQLFTDKLTPFVEVSGFFDVNILSKVADVCCQHPYWSCAHVALEAQFTDAFTFESVKREINSTSCERQQTPLHIVMGDNNTTLIKLLLNCGASPDVGDEKGNTPLHYATEPQFNYLIPDLMMASENKNPQNALLETPINVASRKGNIEGVIAFHKHGGSFAIPDKFTYPILHAYEDENYEMAELILKLNSCEGRRQSATGQTPLHLATSEAQLDLICQASHYLNAQDNDGDTALHLTVKAGELDMAVNLLAKAANPDIANKKGDTPLHTAAEV
ncbi:putative 85/88 kDa calcium-independent phospholipase A2 [Apostichopus japonicus]|uniref:Putative 85/88 kDa calcium-independent phospholipase A2 n=1 Tax=Stichopus japonicus TaxID=307972 RepID=A0A2G8LKS2_STIJA|nr:putative 85/88 kDa calcium-independent phospholipase A2 [Apostichopus japonicus]